MRDVLEELLSAAREEDGEEILEQLLRRAATRGKSRSAQEDSSPERTALTQEKAVSGSARRPAQTEQEEAEAQSGGENSLSQDNRQRQEQWRLLQQTGGTPAQAARFERAAAQTKEPRDGSVAAAQTKEPRDGSAAAAQTEEARHEASAAALLGQLGKSGRAAGRAAASAAVPAPIPDASAGQARSEQALLLAGGVKQVDRAFERDARRYDSQFYLY